MTTNEIRQRFLDFFAGKGHAIAASDSLVPKEDPTVLFTTAGMQQFKKQFLGHIEGHPRAASSQKCLRTDDLEKVGRTDFHHTFFEMLGNFSFGDYFKKEAAAWAWEFLTQELHIPKEKLWVSVYQEDKEAEEIWTNDIRIPAERIVRLGDKSNFWPAEAKEKGPNGPCGPCSEIFYDYGPNPGCANKNCDPGCDCGRFSEIWNLVFTQFNREEGGILEPLPSKNIDTGMGLERLTAVAQGKKSNFETDLFAPIFKAIDQNIDPQKNKLSRRERCVLADHIRAVVFGIADGVVPSNEGRGYVVKRLIVDMTDIALSTGLKEPAVCKLVPSVVEAMGGPYPEIAGKAEGIAEIVKNIEQSYRKVKAERVPELRARIHEIKKSKLSDTEASERLGELIFKYRDTYGLTLSTLQTTLQEEKIPGNIQLRAEEIFNHLMEKQQKKSRAASKMTGDVFTHTDLNLDGPKTEFLGYAHTKSASRITAIFAGNQKISEAQAGDQVKVILDKTPFYAESGGQIGDRGQLSVDHGRIRIQDTQKINDIFVHIGVVEEGQFHPGDQVMAQIDCERRLAIMRNHTATHLLQAALREILGPHVQQQGSLVAEDRLRFDFTHPKAVTGEQLVSIEQRVNDFVLNCDPVGKEFLPIEEARKKGALAFFAEKYGQVVRVVSVGNYSKEFCGGTHLDNTSQIGPFKITTEGAIAQGIRRIEAKTGEGAFHFIHQQEETLNHIARVLKAPKTDLIQRLDQQTKRLKQLERELESARLEAVRNSLDDLLKKSETVKKTKIIARAFQDTEIEMLRKIADLLKHKAKSCIIVLGAVKDQEASILAAVSDDLVKKGLKANDLIEDLAELIHGRGGGRPQMAQAGSKETGRVEKAVQQARQIIKKKFSL